MGIDPSGYNTLEDYAYQKSMQSKTTSHSSNFYIDYYTSKAKATSNTTESQSVGITVSNFYIDFYTGKANGNRNAKTPSDETRELECAFYGLNYFDEIDAQISDDMDLTKYSSEELQYLYNAIKNLDGVGNRDFRNAESKSKFMRIFKNSIEVQKKPEILQDFTQMLEQAKDELEEKWDYYNFIKNPKRTLSTQTKRELLYAIIERTEDINLKKEIREFLDRDDAYNNIIINNLQVTDCITPQLSKNLEKIYTGADLAKQYVKKEH